MSWECRCGIINKDKYKRCQGCGLTPEETANALAKPEASNVPNNPVSTSKLFSTYKILSLAILFAFFKFIYPIYSDGDDRLSRSVHIEQIGVRIKYICVTAIICKMTISSSDGRTVSIGFAKRHGGISSPRILLLDNVIIFDDYMDPEVVNTLNTRTFEVKEYSRQPSNTMPFNIEKARKIGYFFEDPKTHILIFCNSLDNTYSPPYTPPTIDELNKFPRSMNKETALGTQ